MNPYFSQKALHRECITLKENNKTVKNNVELAEMFNIFFSKIVSNLQLNNNLENNVTNPNITDPVSSAIKKYVNYQRILKIKEMLSKKNLSYSFTFIHTKKIFNELQKLKGQNGLSRKQYTGYINKKHFIHNNFNSSYVPSNLKNADITPVLNKRTMKTLKLPPCKHSSGSIKIV